MHPDLEFALELADLADRISAARFRASDLVVSTKPDMTPVTEADQAVEQAILERLEAARPDDAVMGEEYGERDGRAAGAGSAARRWIIDPIDATKNYVRGVPVYATLLALEHAGEIEVGVVSAPALGMRWWAARGEGAFLNGAPIRVSAVAGLPDAHLASDGYTEWEEQGRGDRFAELARACWRSRGFGDFWGHMLVAEGAVDVCVEPVVAAWDVAPILVIVEEAGGRFTDLAGQRRIDGGSVVTTNGLLHDTVLATLQP